MKLLEFNSCGYARFSLSAVEAFLVMQDDPFNDRRDLYIKEIDKTLKRTVLSSYTRNLDGSYYATFSFFEKDQRWVKCL